MEPESTTTGTDRAAAQASLRRAVREGDLAAAAALLEVDASLARTGSERGGSLVLEACERGHDALADTLLRARDGGSMVGMDVHEAAALGRPAALRHALTEDMTAFEDVGPSGFLPLHRAAHGGHLEATTLLLEMGADPAAPAGNQARTSPLESAVVGAAARGPSGAFAAVTRLLVAAGADADARLASGTTAREVAAQRGLEALFGDPTHESADDGTAASASTTAPPPSAPEHGATDGRVTQHGEARPEEVGPEQSEHEESGPGKSGPEESGHGEFESEDTGSPTSGPH